MKILIISTNAEPLHSFEFVKPIEKILKENNVSFSTKHYSELTDKDLENAGKIIITGTSLKDNQFIKDIKNFDWIKTFEKPILGICAGMQIISLVFGAEIKRKTEIGFYREKFIKKFLSLEGEQEVYHLHDNYTTIPDNSDYFTEGKIPQAIKHRLKDIYGVLFHPEVRNKALIEEFIKV